jgi:outer membrane receptor protein involved in Fe transport
MAAVRKKIRVLRCLFVASAAPLAFAPFTAATAQEAQGGPMDVRVPAGNLSAALIALGREAKVQILFTPEAVQGRKSKGVRGHMTFDAALTRLLEGSGLSFRKMNGGSYVVSGPSKENFDKAKRAASDLGADQGYVNGQANIPEILVLGKRSWSLNTDIPRGKDEAQPYTVFSREDIKRSGAPDLDTFFRDYLGANVSVSTAGQRGERDSQINLRGLGLDGTLILVDGRRIADPNVSPNSLSSGTFLQSSIMGIPLEQIERVEVLASSAAGQYGSNAVGGVINIILRRDFRGLELTGYLGGTTDGHAIERRVSANYTFPILKDKFSVTASASWNKADPLLAGDRPFVQNRADFILANNPNYFQTASATSGLIYSTSPNIVAAGSDNLVLKTEYAANGVTALGSRFTFIPVGFQGRSAVGDAGLGAALLANAGNQNVEPGPGNSGGLVFGDRYPLIGGNESRNLSLSTRGDITDWLGIYASASYSRYTSSFESSNIPATIRLQPTSPLNPFLQPIDISFPSPSTSTSRSTMTNRQALGGFIVKLPYSWQGNFDFSKSWGKSTSANVGTQLLSRAYATALANGQIDVLFDTLAFPLQPEFDSEGRFPRQEPSKSTATTYTVKFAGPLGFARLPGGKPVVTLVAETRRQAFGDSVFINDSPDTSSIRYSPARNLSTESVFGELVLPVVSAENKVPLVHDFELRLSGRYDRYTGVGTNSSHICLNNVAGYLTPEQIDGACPAPGVTIPFITTRNNSINPVVAAKWSITPDIAFRGSYSTGYTPPYLSALVEDPAVPLFGNLAPHIPNFISTTVTDPQRGNERIGESILGFLFGLDGATGGNPDVDPQRSESWSFGTILTPRFLPGLTLRADWTQITIRNAYFDPRRLLFASTPEEQAAFEDFLAAHPERFTRAAPGPNDPFSVGRITRIDATQTNLSYYRSEAIDFSGDYQTAIGNGTLSLSGNATLLLDIKRQLTASSPMVDLDGVVSVADLGGVGNSLRFRGTLTANYSTEKWSVGARARHFSGYYLSYLNAATGEYPVNANQGTNRIGGTTFFDLFGSVRLPTGTELRAGINNIFNTRPPTDVTRGLGYAPYGDPRLRSFFVSLTQRL